MKIIHGSPGFGSEMTEKQLMEFLSRKLNLQLGTIDEHNHPNIHPVWFLSYDKKLYIETAKNAKKLQNLRRNNIAYFCIDDETVPYKGVRGKGYVKIHEDLNFTAPIAEKIMIKYTGGTENEVASILLGAVKEGKSVILEIQPKYYSTWDHSKIQ